jgi:uncharacterized caspase-like protein
LGHCYRGGTVMHNFRSLFARAGIASFCLLAGLLPADAAGRVALVVGNSNYKSVGRLANPANDASLMAKTLQHLGFTLVGGGAQLNLDREHFDRLAQRFGREARGADVALFYYAGHGVQIDGTNYLVPTDANPETAADADFQMVDATSMLRQMEASRARLKLMILDACRNNPFDGRGLRAMGGGLAQMQAPDGTIIAFSTQPGHKALDGSNGHSPYTAALARIVQKPGLDILQTFNAVGVAVATATKERQSPWFSSSPIKGDFYFVPAPVKKISKEKPGPTDEETVRFYAAVRSGTKEAFDTFLKAYKAGYYAPLARAERDKIVARLADEEARRKADDARARALSEDRARLAAEIKAAQDAIAKAIKEAAAAKAARDAAEKAAKYAAARGDAAAKAADDAIARAKQEAANAKAAQQAAEKRAHEVIAHQQALQKSYAPAVTKTASVVKGPVSGLKVATLTSGPGTVVEPSTSVLSQTDITQLLKFHLREVGCDPGDGGLWDTGAKHALAEFNKHAGTHLDVKAPTLATLEAVQAAHGRICPLVCGRGTRREGDECIAIICKPGSVLGVDGKCHQTAKAKAKARSGHSGHRSTGLVMGSPEHMRLRAACKGGSIDACHTLCANGGHRACKKAERLSGLRR